MERKNGDEGTEELLSHSCLADSSWKLRSLQQAGQPQAGKMKVEAQCPLECSKARFLKCGGSQCKLKSPHLA